MDITQPCIVHLVDDTTPGGVMRVLEHITSCPRMAETGKHVIQPVKRDAALPRVTADLIVSHLALRWRLLPKLISFRARHAATPLVHVEHSYTLSFATLMVPSRTRFYTLLRTAFALFDRVVAVSSAQADWIRERSLVRKDCLRVIESTIDLAPFRAIPAPSLPPRCIGAIGRLDPQKGFDLLIDAFRQLPDKDVCLDIFGEGPEHDRLVKCAGGDPRIRFRGFAASPQAAIAAVDAVAMPSRWEAFGLVALESRAAGRPLALAQVDGLKDQSTAGTVTVTDPSVAEWIRALGTLLKQQPGVDIRAACVGAEARFASHWGSLICELVGRPDCTALAPDAIAGSNSPSGAALYPSRSRP